MKQAAAAGAYLEFTYLGLIPPAKSTIEDYAAAIRAVGPEHCVLVSDLGRVGDPLHPDGLALFFRALLKQGFSQADIDRMSKIIRAHLGDVAGVRAAGRDPPPYSGMNGCRFSH